MNGNFNALSSFGIVSFGGGTLQVGNLGLGALDPDDRRVGFVTNSSSHITFAPGSGTSLALNIDPAARSRARSPAIPAPMPRVEFVLPASGVTVNVANGFLGGWATLVNPTGNFFATKDGSNNLMALTSTTKDNVATWVVGDNVTDDATGYV